jgi:chromosome segregation ATPase
MANVCALPRIPLGLQRGVVGSTARHKTNSQYYREQMMKYEDAIERLQAEVEKAREGRSKILSFFGTGELAEAKKKLSDKDKQIEKLQQRFTLLEQEQLQLRSNIRQN